MTEDKAKQTPAGGVLIGKREGQTIIHDKGTQGGYFVGRLHKEGGIKGINKSTGQPIEVQGGEVIITAPAVADQTKREFEGQMLTNREILSKINEKGGGVSLENGGEIYYTGSSYNYGGKTMTDYEIMQSMNDCGCEHEYNDGGNIKTYKNKYNKKYGYSANESHDLEEIAKDTGVSIKGLQQIYNKGIGAYKTNPESVRPNVKSKEQWAMARVYSAVMGGKASKVDSNELKMNNGGHLSKGMTLKQIADKHNVTLSKLNNQVKLGLKAESEHTSSKREQMKIVKDHLYENPNYYTILKKVGLKHGGQMNLAKESEKGNTPARDLNNYNDVLDMEADGMVGAETGLAFANGGDLDFLDDAVGYFNNGGSTKEVVEYIEIWSTGSSLSKLYGTKYDNYKDLKKALAEINPQYSYIYLAPNGKSMGSAIDVKKDGRNTVKTINPNTATAKDFEKVIIRSWGEWRMDKYDLSKWLGIKQKNQTSTSTIQSQATNNALPSVNLYNKKIWIGNNEELNRKVQQKAFELGWSWSAQGKNFSYPYTNSLFFTSDKEILKNEEDRPHFDNYKSFTEILPEDLLGGISQATTNALPYIDLKDKQIQINGDIELAKKVVKRAEELGWTDNKAIKNKINDNDIIDYIWFSNSKYVGWSNSGHKNITEAELFGSGSQATSSFNVMNLTKERIDLLFDILQYKNTNNLEVFPANIVTGNSNTISFVDLGSGDVFEFNVEESQSGVKGLYPINEESSKLAFDFIEYEKQLNQMVDDRLKKEAKLLFDENVADLDKIAVKYQDLDFEKEKKDLEALSKLLPAFQGSKNAIQRSMIIKEMDRLNRKITYEGFVLLNEQKSGSEDLFTPQGLLKYYWSQSTQSPIAPLEPPCELPTPNGKKSNLPLSAYLNARTPQFKKWFGDWEKAYETNNYFDCSKYIDDETKEPKIFYHGVRKFVPNFGQFSNMGQGVVRPYGSFEPPTAFPASYFSDNEDYAKFYGGIAPNMPKPSDDYQPFIYKVFIKAKNPLNLQDLGFEASYKDLIDYVLVAYGMKLSPNKNVLEIIGGDMNKKHPVWVYIRNDVSFLEIAKDYGYDSLIQIGDIPIFDDNGNVISDRSQYIQEKEFLTFYANQIKSATVKKSFYFDFFKDIRFNKGGYVRI